MPLQRTIFRIRGLAADAKADQTLQALKTALIACGDATEDELRRIGRVDIVPSCYNDGSSCALFEWIGENDSFLSCLPKDSYRTYQVEVHEEDWTFDRHFLGFTQLFTPGADHPVTAEYVEVCPRRTLLLNRH